MTAEEKIKALDALDINKNTAIDYKRTMRSIGAYNDNYLDYLILHHLAYNDGLNKIKEADFELCSALISYQIRMDHFKKGSFATACQAGKVQPVIDRMKELISSEESR